MDILDTLSDAEKSAIVRFTGDKLMFDTVRKVLEHTITHQGVFKPGETPAKTNWVFNLVSAMDTNEKLGEMVRASAAGLGYLSSGFATLQSVKVDEPKKEKKNPAL